MGRVGEQEMHIDIKTVNTVAQVNTAMALIERVFMIFEAPDYEQDGIDAFLDYIEPAAIYQRINAEEIKLWCAMDHGVMVGVIAMRPPCAVSLLFVEPKWHRRGIARQLLEHALSDYRKADTPVTVHSSPYAVAAYRRLGFVETGPETTVSGIRYQPMICTK